jgi:DEAD/DEAH box helicase domain-containing protein
VPAPPWKNKTGLDPVIAGWLASGYVRPCLAADRQLPPVVGRYAPIPEDLAPGLTSALRGRGIDRLYAHQAAAVAAARAKKHVVVATPTASGKSLCFHLPVLDTLTREPDASAIYLYPTKALSRDQEAGIHALIREAGLNIPAIVYDGDTPGDARRAARERSPIVMTNPDMLHAGILPHHAHWARTFQRLRYVVLDELHTYRGVFGSHVAHVLQRLRRVAAFHGADPTFLCATATIRNPREHAARLLGVDPETVEVVDESGAPRGARRFFLYNPPVVNAELGIRASTLKSAVRLAADLVRARVPTIVFGQSRNSVEIMLKYLREATADAHVGDGAIMAYRGGYLPETRRRVEHGLREGEILCVVATNALELGIDIGELDAVVCAGYPGSIAETWQRFGRAGRRGGMSAAVLVASSAPVDQYLARSPDHLFESAVEQARIDPSNTEILIQHLKCSAFELPFLGGEPYAMTPPDDTRDALRFLADHGVVHESDGRFHWATDAYPANHVSLRSVGWDNFVIIDKAHGKTLAELDWRAAPTMLHEQAIYQHDGEQYQVERLDYENHKAFVTKVLPDYFTTAMTNRKVTVIDETARSPLGRAEAAWGEVSVVEKVVGYKKIKFHTHENTGYGDVRLPDIQMHTTSFWLTIPARIFEETGMGRGAGIDGLRGIGRALETVATLSLMCDPRDIGQTLGDAAEDGESAPSGGSGGHGAMPGYDPTVFLFDNIPGGVGLAERIYEQAEDLLARAKMLITGCSCDAGCPLCVGATDASPGVFGVRKRAAVALLARLMHT